MVPKHPVVPPMTLGNTRHLAASCLLAEPVVPTRRTERRRSLVDDVEVLSFASGRIGRNSRRGPQRCETSELRDDETNLLCAGLPDAPPPKQLMPANKRKSH
jgi:hypothetical protein